MARVEQFLIPDAADDQGDIDQLLVEQQKLTVEQP
jgi:hypothetical protein